ncbi:uncharacterized protein Hap1MRO34_005782 isoform 1-T3 [Clarias gariepinus]|uniref:UPF0488 protein C8orf33 homolog n=1 Tax=Clarias gariepinus TaxID=13013 RepID=UPI00234C27CF|nr:UPF0488 protein C8orf33 homolog [Clarias gariepinus]XP_053350796.1 UPF0488 protein C8orf33 homolog [Clarias gariepinus]XP_053350797.1 UPF0488 protein C8orf33 homolog [Clarias gariepinus]
MGKTADLTVDQKTIIDTLHKEGKPQKYIAKKACCSQSAVSKHIRGKMTGREKCGRKRCTSNKDDRSLEKIVMQSRYKNLLELHKEWSEAGVKASRATTYRRLQEMGYAYCIPSTEELSEDIKLKVENIKKVEADEGEEAVQENVNHPGEEAAVKEESIELSPEQHQSQELDWCVEQLQLRMKVQKNSTKQRKEACRALKTLRSSKAPMEKKRQVMRAVSEDYYKKMEEEKEKQDKLIHLAISSAKVLRVLVPCCRAVYNQQAKPHAPPARSTDTDKASLPVKLTDGDAIGNRPFASTSTSDCCL